MLLIGYLCSLGYCWIWASKKAAVAGALLGLAGLFIFPEMVRGRGYYSAYLAVIAICLLLYAQFKAAGGTGWLPGRWRRVDKSKPYTPLDYKIEKKPSRAVRLRRKAKQHLRNWRKNSAK